MSSQYKQIKFRKGKVNPITLKGIIGLYETHNEFFTFSQERSHNSGNHWNGSCQIKQKNDEIVNSDGASGIYIYRNIRLTDRETLKADLDIMDAPTHSDEFAREGREQDFDPESVYAKKADEADIIDILLSEDVLKNNPFQDSSDMARSGEKLFLDASFKSGELIKIESRYDYKIGKDKVAEILCLLYFTEEKEVE